jgi:hypothetical protein
MNKKGKLLSTWSLAYVQKTSCSQAVLILTKLQIAYIGAQIVVVHPPIEAGVALDGKKWRVG